MARKTAEESLKTRERILDAAEQVFAGKGLSRAGMADIAAAAGVSRGAVYGHYRNKQAVFMSMCDRVWELFPIPAPRPDASAYDLLLDSAMNFLRQSHSPGTLHNILEILTYKCEHTQENAPILQYLRDRHEKVRVDLRSLLTNARQKGELAPALDIDLMIFVIQSVVNGIYTLMPFSNQSLDSQWGLIEKGLRQVFDAFFVTPARPVI